MAEGQETKRVATSEVLHSEIAKGNSRISTSFRLWK
ncbi:MULTISPECIES: DUF2767 family protein [Rahnella]|nr:MULTISPECIES: DUF2767 family protein [Rahnella]